MTTIDYRTGTYYGEAEQLHIWEAFDGGEVVGELYVTLDTLEVANIEVNEDRRGEGIARQLWEAANAQMGTVYHAYEAHRTEDGAGFAAAVGGEEITECAVADCYCSAA